MSGKAISASEIVQLLKGTALFKETDEAAINYVVSRLEIQHFHKGDPISLENEISDHVYFVFSGSVEVVKLIPELKQMQRLAVLKPGAQFSEFSVLNRTNKGASVFALEECALLRMSGEDFLDVLNRTPTVAKHLVQNLARMSMHAITSRDGLEYVQLDSVTANPTNLQVLPQKLWRKYNVLPLRFENNSLFVAMKDPQNKEFFNLVKGSHPSVKVNVCLITDADFERLEKDLINAYGGNEGKFPKSLKQTVRPPIENVNELLCSLSIFKQFPADYVAQLAAHVKVEMHQPGAQIYTAGTNGDGLYVLQTGLVEISRTLKHGMAGSCVANLGPGDYFSEISLLSQSAHLLNARAITSVKLLKIPAQVFNHLLGSPYFTLPLARDLALRFQRLSNFSSIRLFDSTKPVQVAQLANLLPKEIVTGYRIMPLRLTDNELVLGALNADSELIHSVISRYLLSYRISIEIVSQNDFKKWLAEFEAAQSAAKPAQAKAAPAEKDTILILDKILSEGFSSRASDIHIEPNAETFVVRYRVDGVLQESPEKYEKGFGVELISRIKILCGLDTTNRFTPQDGQLKFEYQGSPAFARVSILPTKHGENAVLRLVQSKNVVPPLSVIVPDRRVVSILKSVTQTKQGVFLVTGPTGSGKSTTLYSLLKELNRVEVSIVTLEDPVELEVGGTTQVEMNEKVGLTFAASLRSVLRQDPNVLMIGEIRDEESAKIAFHAAMTGHLVLSTLHTSHSLDIVPRLRELGISSAALSSGLLGASAQRLLRQICLKCRTRRPITDVDKSVLREYLGLTKFPDELMHGTGCIHCGKSGYRGRISVMETWRKTRTIESLLAQGASIEDLTQEIKRGGFDTLVQFALRMVLNGLTTMEEVERGLGAFQLTSNQPSVKETEPEPEEEIQPTSFIKFSTKKSA